MAIADYRPTPEQSREPAHLQRWWAALRRGSLRQDIRCESTTISGERCRHPSLPETRRKGRRQLCHHHVFRLPASVRSVIDAERRVRAIREAASENAITRAKAERTLVHLDRRLQRVIWLNDPFSPGSTFPDDLAPGDLRRVECMVERLGFRQDRAHPATRREPSVRLMDDVRWACWRNITGGYTDEQRDARIAAAIRKDLRWLRDNP